eukprot:scaffold82613_cov33-Tisochrysis_lutea.AAC.7
MVIERFSRLRMRDPGEPVGKREESGSAGRCAPREAIRHTRSVGGSSPMTGEEWREERGGARALPWAN